MEIEIEDGLYEILERLTKKLNFMQGLGGILKDELEERLRTYEVWVERIATLGLNL